MKITRNVGFFILLLVVMIVAWQFWVFSNWTMWIVATILMIVWWLSVLILWWDNLVEWAHSVADHYNIPPLIVGMTILAMWTSMPELFVNMIAAFRGETALLLSNIIWSNISNLLLIWWVTAIITPLFVKKSTLYKELPISLWAWVLLLVLISDHWFWIIWDSFLSRIDGIIMLVCFAAFLFRLFQIAKNNPDEDDDDVTKHTLGYSTFLIALGIWWLYVWWEALVTHASNLASMFNVSKVLIWASIVAIWTSVPELVTSVIAALKKHTDMALWNILWSNVFNILWIWWLTATIQPILVDPIITTDLFIFIWATILVFLFITLKKDRSLYKVTWILMVLLYFCYIAFLLRRW